MKISFLVLCAYCFLGVMLSGVSNAELFDDLKKAGSAFKDSIKKNTGKAQDSSNINYPPSDKNTVLAESVTDISIKDFSVRCPPFGKDDTWHIRRVGYLSNGMNNSSEITDVIIYADSKTVKLRRTGTNSVEQEDEYLLNKGDIYLIKNTVKFPMGVVEIDFTPDVPVCPLPEVGSSFTGKGQLANNEAGEMTFTVVSIHPFFVEVTMPAGTFKTRKIDIRTIMKTQEQGQKETRETMYFADGIGIVKEIVRFSGNIEVYELLEYKF